MDEAEFAQKAHELTTRIANVCHGKDVGLVVAGMTMMLAKATASSMDPANAINEVTTLLKRLHAEELEEIKNAN